MGKGKPGGRGSAVMFAHRARVERRGGFEVCQPGHWHCQGRSRGRGHLHQVPKPSSDQSQAWEEVDMP